MYSNKKRLILTLSILVVLIGTLLLSGKSIAKRFFPLNYGEEILTYSEKYNLDPYVVAAVIKTESNYDVKATSPREAKGLMQLMDDTAKWIAVQLKESNFNPNDIYDPELNIKFGCWYLDNLRKEFKGDMDLVLAAYNAGSGNVKGWLKNKQYSEDGETLQYIPFKETDKYIKRVKVNYSIYKYLYPEFKS